MAAAVLGIPQLDRVLPAPPEGARVALLNDPGIEGEAFLYHAAASHLAAGDDIVYCLTNRSPTMLRAAMEDLGFAVKGQPGKLLVLDAFSALMGAHDEAAWHVPDPSDPAQLVRALEHAATERPGAVLMFDSVSQLVDRSPPGAFARALPGLHAAMGRFRLSLSLFTRWPYDDLDLLLDPFDAVVGLRSVEDRVQFTQFFAVERTRWGEADTKPRLFRVERPGGVSVYIPKVLVTGPHNAGKSTFIHAASDQSASADWGGTTVALDHGHISMDGLTADLFGTPGQARFDPILRTLASQALGVIVVVDATDPDSLPRAREMMQRTTREGLPVLIAANKQDQPGALTPEVIAGLLDVPGHAKVVGCTASDPASARRVLHELFDQIVQGAVRP